MIKYTAFRPSKICSTMGESSETRHGEKLGVSWVFPAPWLITGVVVVAANVASIYYGQLGEKEARKDLSESVKDMAIQLRELRSLVNSTNIKDIEHDLKLADHDRRIVNLEAKSVK